MMLTPVKSFFKWLTQENYLLYNPASELVLPRKPRRLPLSILRVVDTQAILLDVDTGTPEGIRDCAILQTLFVHSGKGDQDRYVPLGASAYASIAQYTEHVRRRLVIDAKEPHLFLRDYGEPFNGSYLSALVKGCIRRAGLSVTGSCHLFRHAMATHMLENGADVRFIQTMLGHSDLNTTQICTRVGVNTLSEIHRTTHPGCQLTREKTEKS